MIQNLRKFAVKLDVSGTAKEVVGNTALYKDSFGFVLLQAYVPVTQQEQGKSFCTVHRVVTDSAGRRKVFNQTKYQLLYVDTVTLEGKEYMRYEAPMPKSFADTVGTLDIVFNYYVTNEDKIVARLTTNTLTLTVSEGGATDGDVEMSINEGQAAQIDANTRTIESLIDSVDDLLQEPNYVEDDIDLSPRVTIAEDGRLEFINIKGTNGHSFTILGTVSDVSLLPTSAEYGAAYMVGAIPPRDVYILDGITGEWLNQGKIEGPQGLQGIQGFTGDTGPKGDKGISTRFRGQWDVSVEYRSNSDFIDIASYQGSSYYVKQTNIGFAPVGGPSDMYWGLVALKGDTGAQGAQGVQGLQGIQGQDGVDGRSFTIKGMVATFGDLPANPSAGDAWAVGSTASNVIYVYNDMTEAWDNLGSLMGPRGFQGEQGIQGVQGLQGIQGEAGPQGPQPPLGSLLTPSPSEAVSTQEAKSALDNKVDKVAGKGLSESDFTTTEKDKLSTIAEGAQVNPTASQIKILYETNADTNAFTDNDKTKLAGIQAGAQVNPTIVDNFTSTSSTSVLSANMGRELNVNKTESVLTGTLDNLSITASSGVKRVYGKNVSGTISGTAELYLVNCTGIVTVSGNSIALNAISCPTLQILGITPQNRKCIQTYDNGVKYFNLSNSNTILFDSVDSLYGIADVMVMDNATGGELLIKYGPNYEYTMALSDGESAAIRFYPGNTRIVKQVVSDNTFYETHAWSGNVRLIKNSGSATVFGLLRIQLAI